MSVFHIGGQYQRTSGQGWQYSKVETAWSVHDITAVAKWREVCKNLFETVYKYLEKLPEDHSVLTSTMSRRYNQGSAHTGRQWSGLTTTELV